MTTAELHLLRSTVEQNKLLVDNKINTIEERLENKVPWQAFKWFIAMTVGVLVTVMGGMIALELDTNKNVSLIDKTVSQLQGKLDPYTITYPK